MHSTEQVYIFNKLHSDFHKIQRMYSSVQVKINITWSKLLSLLLHPTEHITHSLGKATLLPLSK